MADTPKPEELAKIDHTPPVFEGWIDTPPEIRRGIACYGSKPKDLEYVGLPNPRDATSGRYGCKRSSAASIMFPDVL